MAVLRKNGAQGRSSERIIAKEFGRVVREAREEKQISQEELGFRSGIDRTYVGGVERGERNPTLLTIQKIARGLGVKIGELMRRIG